MTKQEENIYNTHLRITRSCENKPFTLRKDFSSLDDTVLLNLKKIGNMFRSYPHVDMVDYFTAPYKVYPNAEHFDLSYYAGMGAIEAYSLYMKQIQELSPDSPEQINFISRSLKRIGTFCIKNNITIDEFPTFKLALTYEWMKLLKRHEISIYSLMEFPDITDIISSTPEDERELFLGSVGKYYLNYKIKYAQSKEACNLVKTGIDKITKIIKETD